MNVIGIGLAVVGFIFLAVWSGSVFADSLVKNDDPPTETLSLTSKEDVITYLTKPVIEPLWGWFLLGWRVGDQRGWLGSILKLIYAPPAVVIFSALAVVLVPTGLVTAVFNSKHNIWLRLAGVFLGPAVYVETLATAMELSS